MTLVERLRAHAGTSPSDGTNVYATMREAADEIERLTLEAADAEKRTQSWQDLISTYSERATQAEARAERMREVLSTIMANADELGIREAAEQALASDEKGT